ncbi:cell envelope integrity protein TolA [Extensimonas vulgaris]|nr:cell envelope integrity protein TolA [Extensimonas vulgaris]TXD12883.1 cell envelope integrity protein TolA [Extensimonas vulgaris]
MPSTMDREPLAPPPPPGRWAAVLLSLLAHALLLAALAWGVRWKASSEQTVVQAELWAALPQQAAPRMTPPPPPPPPSPEPAPAPHVPKPLPPVPMAAPDTHDADIALERQRKREEQARQQALERAREEKRAQAKREREQREKEKAAQEKAAQEKAARAKAEREKAEREKAEQERLAQQKKQAEDKRKAEALARQLEAQRQENLRRMQSLAGANGDATATGKDLRSAGPLGPSSSYAGKVVAKVRPNIVYPDEIVGNPRAEVEVRTAPDGTIVGTRLLQSSGNKAWDDAVLRALQKTETLPRDIDGRVPPSLVIVFRPKD